MAYQFGTFLQEKERRLETLASKGLGARLRFESALDENFKDSVPTLVQGAYEYAGNLDYDHVGLDSETYLAHPLRVGEMVLSLPLDISADWLVVALLHNVLEVGQIERKEIADRFGERVANAISALTVDRSLQWDDGYKANYYDQISKCGRAAEVVKVLDKLDNLFVLSLNPDRETKRRYLKEIDRYVIPLCQRALPEMEAVFVDAAAEALQEFDSE